MGQVFSSRHGGASYIPLYHGASSRSSLQALPSHHEPTGSGSLGNYKAECSFCEEMFLLGEMSEHMKTCPHKTVRCSLCSESFSPPDWVSGHPACFSSLDSGVRMNENTLVLLDQEGLKVVVMLCYFQKKVYISPIGLAGEKQIEEYRVQFSLGEDYLTALLPISGWS